MLALSWRWKKTPPPAWPFDCCICGNHSSDECKFKGVKNGKVEHITPVRRSKPGKGRPSHAQWGQSSGKVTLYGQRWIVLPSYNVELHMNGQPLIMGVDTGASVSIAPESELASLFTNKGQHHCWCGLQPATLQELGAVGCPGTRPTQAWWGEILWR